MVPAELKVVSRSSPLALLQVEEALGAISEAVGAPVTYQLVSCTTPGDRDLKIDLADPAVPDDFFTRDLDRMLLDGQADLSVNSAKDLPEQMPEGLRTILLPSRDIRDALVVAPGLARGQDPRVIGTSSPRRGDEILRLLPDAELKPIRGTIQQRIEQLDRGDYDGVIIAACALERLDLQDRIDRYLPYDPAPQQGRLALVYATGRRDLDEWLQPLDICNRAGLVALVGCPADPALASPRALDYLQQADVIFHDRLIPSRLLESVRDKCIPVGKTGGGASTPQSEIHRLMLTEAEQGRLVVRLHGGDPAIYGHLAEELQFLSDWNIRTDVVPAVTAAQLAAARARAPLTLREGSGRLCVLPGYKARGTPTEPYPGPDAGTLAVYMGVAALPDIRSGLLRAGWPEATPVLIAERLGEPDEGLTAALLADAHQHQTQTPAVFLVGSRAYPSGSWTLFTGTDPRPFLRHGPLLHLPLIALEAKALEDRAACIDTLLPEVDGIIFPSRFAVKTFMEALLTKRDARALAGKIILTVGPATERCCAEWGLKADASARDYGGAQALADDLDPTFQGRYLYPCSDASPVEERIRALGEKGIELLPHTFYANHRTPRIPYPRLPVDRVLFTSTSCVEAYFDHYPEEGRANRSWIAVGPSTLRALQALDLNGPCRKL